MGFGVVSFFGESTVGSGVERGWVGSGVGTIGVAFGSGVEFFVATLVEPPLVRIYAIATAERPSTKTIARIHGSGLRFPLAGSSLIGC